MDRANQPPQDKKEQSNEKGDWKCDIIGNKARIKTYTECDKGDGKPKVNNQEKKCTNNQVTM